MRLLLITLTLISMHTHADFFDAQDNYDEKKYNLAFNEYLALSKLGNRQAQYNVALMYFNGQGVNKDLSKAHAWVSLVADEHKEFKKLSDLISSEISKNELESSSALQTEIEKYRYKNFKELNGPEKQGDKTSRDFSNLVYYKRTKKSQKKPEYPRKVIDEGGRGWVDILYNIYPDGTTRDIYIKNQYPHSMFGPPSVDFISKQHYQAFKNKETVTPTSPRFSIQRISYGIKGISGLLNKEQKRYLNELMKMALAGSVEAQYKYIKYYNTVLNKSSSVSGFIIANWMFQAAQYGIIDAQFMIGYTLYYGQNCKRDIEKGLKWLTRAANAGHAQASYYLYQILSHEDVNNTTEHDPIYWLDKSIEHDLTIAKFVKAKSLVHNGENLELAQKYLDSYQKEVGKTIDWYLIQSKLFFANKETKKLKKTLKEGKKLAKKYGWQLKNWEEFE